MDKMVVLKCVDCGRVIKRYCSAKDYRDEDLPRICLEKRHTFTLGEEQ